jgi:hypothetical protein
MTLWRAHRHSHENFCSPSLCFAMIPNARVSKRKFARRNKTALWAEDKLRPLSKLRIWVENIPKKWKIKIKRLWLWLWALQRFMGPFLALRVPDLCTGWTPLS